MYIRIQMQNCCRLLFNEYLVNYALYNYALRHFILINKITSKLPDLFGSGFEDISQINNKFV